MLDSFNPCATYTECKYGGSLRQSDGKISMLWGKNRGLTNVDFMQLTLGYPSGGPFLHSVCSTFRILTNDIIPIQNETALMTLFSEFLRQINQVYQARGPEG